jgi:Domain of unknown function (DUF5107)
MGVDITTCRKYLDLQMIDLENEYLHIVILPELGAKIWKLNYKPKNREMLWHNPNLEPRRLPLNSDYDDHFFGGWDELYPNDQAETVNGQLLPDHGEIWTLPWKFEITGRKENEVTVHLWVNTPITKSRVEKWVTLKAEESCVHFRHKITNNGEKEQPFLWKPHIAVNIDAPSRIDMSAAKMYIEDFGPPRNGKTGISYNWPFVTDEKGETHDMRMTLPVDSEVNEFQYGLELKEGWCSVTDCINRLGIGIAFDNELFHSCWLFATYGGWRNLNTAVLEPCTGYPVNLNDGLSKGTHQVLSPNGSIETELVAVVYEGLDKVTSITRDGKVIS